MSQPRKKKTNRKAPNPYPPGTPVPHLDCQLDAILKARRMTNWKLHQLTGVPYSRIGQLRRQALAQIAFKNLAKICVALDIHPGELFHVSP